MESTRSGWPSLDEPRPSRSSTWRWVLFFALLVGVPIAVPVAATNWPPSTGDPVEPAPTAGAIRSAAESYPGPEPVPADPRAAPARSTARPAPRPDLVVVALSWTPTTLRDGDLVSFAARVRNVGTAPAGPGGLDVAFLVERNEVAWSRRDTRPLAPGAERVYVADGGPIGYAFWFAILGRHTVAAVVDPRDRVVEISEVDNSRVVSLTVRR